MTNARLCIYVLKISYINQNIPENKTPWNPYFQHGGLYYYHQGKEHLPQLPVYFLPMSSAGYKNAIKEHGQAWKRYWPGPFQSN